MSSEAVKLAPEGDKQAPAPVHYKRHLKNYLLDKSYQLRYTTVIVLISAALTAGLAFAFPQWLISNFHGPWLVDVVASVCSLA